MSGGARGPWIAVGLAAGLGLVYWGWVLKIQPERAKAAADAQLLFKGLNAQDTREILLKKEGSADVLLRKVDKQWRLISPIEAPADPDAVGTLVSELAGAKRAETVVAKGADLRDFGLDKPSGEVTFKPASPGAKAEVLYFGMDSPEGNETYGLIDGQPAVFLVDKSVKDAVLKSAAQLRDKTVWSFDPLDVEQVRSDISGFTLSRNQTGQWEVHTPTRHDPGKGDSVDNWLQTLSRLRADSVPSETGKGNFGLRRAKTLGLTLKDGVRLVLKEGSKVKPSMGVYVQVAGQGPVFELPYFDASILEKKAPSLMDLAVFQFQTGDVQRFTVQRPQGTLNAVKKDGVWAWSPAPAGPPPKTPFDFYAFLSGMANTQLIRRLSAKDAPLTPTASVTFYGDNGIVLEKAVFGRKMDGGQVASSYQKHQTVLAVANLLDALPSRTRHARTRQAVAAALVKAAAKAAAHP